MEIAKKLKGKKGLTLIELLAVLVIVGIIAAIAVPAIGGTISRSRDRADAASQVVIREAAMRYATDRVGQAITSPLPVNDNGNTGDDLVGLGYLNAAPTFNNALHAPTSVTIGVTADTGAITVALNGGTGFKNLNP